MKVIPLTKGNWTFVDDEDYEYLRQWRWHVTAHGYAARSISEKNPHEGKTKGELLMHRLLLNAQHKQEVDHRDLDKLNNQRYNIRLCTSKENKMNRPKLKNNTSGFKGVYLRKRTGTFIAAISINSKLVHLGTFRTAEAAAKAYQDEAKKHHGDFIRFS